jgi:hypothetical protein
MDAYYPNSAWLCLRKDVFDPLSRFKRAGHHATWEQAVGSAADRERRSGERSSNQTECLVLGDGSTTLDITVRFLHVMERTGDVQGDHPLERRAATGIRYRGLERIMSDASNTSPCVLVAGIGNIFGVEVAQRLMLRALPAQAAG